MKKVFLLSLPLLAFIWAFSPVASFKVGGKVRDKQGMPVAGASVTVKGTSTGTTSASDGSYSIEADSEKDELVFSAVGFDVKNVKIKGRSVIDVVLKAAEQHLEEVVITTDENSEMRKDINSSPAPSFNNSLQGRAPGAV